MASLGSLAVNIVARTSKFSAGITKAMEHTHRFTQSMERSAKVAAKWSAIAGGAAATAVAAGMAKAADRIDRLAKTSDKLGITTENLASLRFAAEQTGVSVGTLDTALQRMVRRTAEAAKGTGEARGAIAELGLNAAKLGQMAPDKQFQAVAEATKNVGNQGDRVRLSMKLFDSEGVALVNTLKVGSAGLAQYAEDAKSLGLTISREGAAKVEAMNDALHRATQGVSGFFNKLTVELAPSIEMAADKFTTWMQKIEDTGGSLTSSFAPATATLGLVADVAFTVELAFQGLQTGIVTAAAWGVRGANEMQKAFVGLANTIPGVEIEASSMMRSLAETMEAQAATMQQKTWDRFLGDPPSVRIAKMAEDAAKSMKPIKIHSEIVAPTLSPAAANVLRNLGKGLGGLSNVAQRSISAATQVAGNALSAGGAGAAVPRPELVARQAGSVDTYAASRRNLRGGSEHGRMKKLGATNEKQLSVLKDIEKGISGLTGFDVPVFRIDGGGV